MAKEAARSKTTWIITFLVDVLIVVLTCVVLHHMKCFSVSDCTSNGLVIAARVMFLLFNGVLLAVLCFLVSQAAHAENTSDVEALKKRLWAQLAKFGVLGFIHLCYGNLFPLVSGTLISIVGLPIWTDFDGTYLKKYWKSLSGWSFLNAMPSRQCNELEFLFDLVIISLALIIFAVLPCKSSTSCRNFVLFRQMPYVSLSLIGLIILVRVYLYCKITAAAIDESYDDARRVRFSTIKLAVKTALLFSLFKFVGMEAPLVAAPFMTIVQAQLFTDYDASLWSKYHDAPDADSPGAQLLADGDKSAKNKYTP